MKYVHKIGEKEYIEILLVFRSFFRPVVNKVSFRCFEKLKVLRTCKGKTRFNTEAKVNSKMAY